MSFRFDAKKVLLTYSQTPHDADGLFEFINGLAAVLWARIALETHEDGGQHMHAAVEFRERFSSRQARVFDYNGSHPNIQYVRSVRATLEYLKKEAFRDYGDVPSSAANRARAQRRSAREVLEETQGASELEYLMACSDANIQWKYAERFRQLINRDLTNTIMEDYIGDVLWEHPILTAQQPDWTKSIVVIGPGGCGKSAWAKRVVNKPALFVTHQDTLRQFDPSFHKSIIFDDMCFTHVPLQAQIHLTDQDNTRQIHARYGNAVIPAHTQKVFTCNVLPFIMDEHGAIQRRIQIIDCYQF